MRDSLLSVIMTNYNGSRFLENRLESILVQLREKDEIVLVDDGSTDDSIAIIERIMTNERRLVLLRNSRNLGVIPSVNRALGHARGAYIASLAVDDRILPGFIEETMSVLLQHPDIAICCSDCGLSFDGIAGKDPQAIETTVLLDTNQQTVVFHPHELISVFRTTPFWIPGHTSIVKRDCLLKYGGFRAEFEHLCDWFLLHSIALREGVAYIPKTLSVWRQHTHTYSADGTRSQAKKKEIYKQLFITLTAPQNRSLRRPFAASTVLHFYVRSSFWFLLLRPFYWDFLMPVVCKVLRRRWRRGLDCLSRRRALFRQRPPQAPSEAR